MKELLDKLASYNLFNYLLPGVLFAFLSKLITSYSFIQQDILIGAFLYYFIGMIISRFGSLVIEPILKKTKFIIFADYNKFISKSKEDSKIEILSEANNTYRTIIAMFILLLLLKLYNMLENTFAFLSGWNLLILLVTVFTLFVFSYKKQTKYIKDRVEPNR